MRRLVFAAAPGLLTIGIGASLAVAQSSFLLVSVDCAGSNESVTVTNHAGEAVVVRSIGSLHQPGPDEPFVRSDWLAAGSSITYGFGPNGADPWLSDRPIFEDTALGEGVWVDTSAGVAEALCSAGLGTLTVGRVGTPVVPTLAPTATPVVPPAAAIPGAVDVVGTTGGGVQPVDVPPTTAEGAVLGLALEDDFAPIWIPGLNPAFAPDGLPWSEWFVEQAEETDEEEAD